MMDICKDFHQPDQVYTGRDLLFVDVSAAYPDLFDMHRAARHRSVLFSLP
jgi:hypothetical protein